MPIWSLDKVSLSEETNLTISRLGFAKPTPVQSAAIPLFLSHKDVVVEAVTGSGKTLAFLIPIVEILKKRKPALRKNEVGAIIVSPTRELAIQTWEVLGELLKDYPELKQVILIGGAEVSQDFDRIAENGCNILVTTPGRLLDILERNTEAVVVKSLEILVLDEADRLLNLGFERTINSILERLPKQRRTGLFSATMSDALSELIRTGLRNPVKVTIKVENTSTKVEQRTPESLKSFYTICDYEHRLPFTLNFLRNHSAKKTIMYFGTCASVEYFNRAIPLLPKGILKGLPSIVALHGRMEHRKRQKIYHEFLTAERSIMICTDLAARGLDFSDVDLVLQYEAPQDPTTFIHRCGRTARSGRSGEALLLLSQSEDNYVEFLSNRKVPLVELPPSSFTSLVNEQSFFEDFRKVNSEDRDLHQRSVKAFVAHIRFYQEHLAKFIFRLKDLNISGVAKSFGLLCLPKMNELKDLKVTGFEKSPIEVGSINFKDPHLEKQKRASFEAMKKRNAVAGNNPSRKRTGLESLFEDRKNRHLSTGISSSAAAAGSSSIPNKVDMGELEEDWKEYKKLKRKNN